jgi:hypothetical protein
VPRARVTIVHPGTGATTTATTDPDGRWMTANVPSGPIQITVEASGFKTIRTVNQNGGGGSRFDFSLDVGSVNESVMVNAETKDQRNTRQNASADQAASVNVMELQKRVAGVLPIAVTVPRTGSSYRFVRPLVVDEETKLSFSYRSGK